MLDMGHAQLAELNENELEPHAHKESVVTPTNVLRDQMSRLLEKVRNTQGMVSRLERRGFKLSQLRHREAPYEVGTTIRDDSAERNQYSRLAILKRMGILKQDYDDIRTHSVAILGLGSVGSLIAEQMVRSGGESVRGEERGARASCRPCTPCAP